MAESHNFLSDINDKYRTQEMELDQKLKVITQTEIQFDKMMAANTKPASKIGDDSNCILDNLELLKIRNRKLIKELEIAKARLRSKATFNPLEHVLEKTIENYINEISLAPVLKKVYGPTFV